MKSSKKVLALALAAAMVVTAVPTTNASAATTGVAKSKTYYAGKSYTLTLTTPKSWKSVKTTWTSSKKSVAKVAKTSTKKAKVTAVKAGTANVKVKVTYKKSSKKNAKTYTKTYTCKVTVKTPSIAVAGDSVVAVGQTTALKATVKPSTATVSYKTSDDKIATVDANGVVTGVAAGEATITATTTVGGKDYTADQKVTVKKAILKSTTQTASKKLEAVIVGDTKDLKAADFKITNTATNATVAVKSVTAKKNVADTFVIETFAGMTDAKEYTVAYDGTTVNFTATDGVVAKVGVTTTEIAAASATEVKATTIDKNGVILDETGIDETDSSKGKVTSAVSFTKGYQDGSKLYLPAVGDTATIKVTYHTGTFGTDGKETGNIEDTFTVKAIDPSLINLSYAVTIDTKAPAWTANSFKANNQVKIGDPRTAYFRITKDDGNDIDNYGDYTVETADKTKLLVANTTINSNSNPISVNGVAEGTTYILIKKDDKTVASLPISVVAKPVASSLALDKTSVTVAKGVSAVTESVKATIKDQYNDDMTTDSIEITVLGKPDANATINGNNIAVGSKLVASDFTISSDNRTVSVSGDKFVKTGTYTFKISSKNGDKTLDRTFTVNVVNPTTVQAYEVKVDNAEVDTTIDKNGTLPASITVTTSQMSNGAAVAPVTYSAIKYVVKKGSDTIYETNGKTSAAIHAGNKVTAENGDLVIQPVLAKDGNNHFNKVLSAGTYNVTATFTVAGKTVTVGSSFVIKDTQDSKVTYKIEKNNLDGQTVATAFTQDSYVKVYYDGQQQTILAADVDSVDGTIISGTASAGAFVKTVKLYVTVSGSNGDVKVPVTLTVNDQFSNCSGLK